MNTKKMSTKGGSAFSGKNKISRIIIMAATVIVLPLSAMAAVDYNVNYNSATGGINVNLGSRPQGGYGSWALTNNYGLPGGSLLGIVSNLLFWMLTIFAIVGVIGFVLSGIFYLLSGADEGNAEKGKNGMKWSIIGIIVGLSGFIIMQAVNLLLGGGSKNF